MHLGPFLFWAFVLCFIFLLLFFLAGCHSLSSAQDSLLFLFLGFLFSCKEAAKLSAPQWDEIGKGRINCSQLSVYPKLPPFMFFPLTGSLVFLRIPDSLTLVSGLVGDKVIRA